LLRLAGNVSPGLISAEGQTAEFGDGVPSFGEDFFISAPRGVQHFSIDAVGEVVLGEIVPEKASPRIV